MSLSTFNTVRRGGSSEEPGDRERYRELWRSTTKEVALHRFAEELTLFIESHQLSAVSLLFLLIAESLIHKRSVISQTALEYIQVPHYYMGSSQVDGPMFA